MSKKTNHSQVTVEIVQVTPSLAQEMLEKNKSNRPVRNNTVNSYARQMKENSWMFNGDMIRFDIDDELIDGQHRLLAVVVSGKTIPMVIQKGLPKEAKLTIDIGQARKGGEIWAINNGIGDDLSRGCLLNAESAARIVYNLASYVKDSGGKEFTFFRSDRLAPNEVAIIMRKLPDIQESTAWANRNRKLGYTSTLAAFHWVVSNWCSEAEIKFLSEIDSKPSNDALNAYLFVTNRKEAYKSSTRVTRVDNFCSLFHAMDMYREGVANKRLIKARFKFPEGVINGAKKF